VWRRGFRQRPTRRRHAHRTATGQHSLEVEDPGRVGGGARDECGGFGERPESGGRYRRAVAQGSTLSGVSQLFERPGPPGPLPTLDGREVLVDPSRPDACKVKGSMFAGRKRFLTEQFGDAEFQAVLSRLTARTLSYAVTPLSVRWCEFASLVEYDRAIYERLSPRHPHILALLGAASAEFGMGTVYKSLDNAELIRFLERIPLFHDQYLKFGRVVFGRAPGGVELSHFDYPCYSPVFCASATGFFLEAILRHGGRDPEVLEPQCHCRGDGVCRFTLRWS